MRSVTIIPNFALIATMLLAAISVGVPNAPAALPISNPSFSFFDPFLGLTLEDQAIVEDTIVHKLVPQKEDGASAQWSNPNTGSSGKVTFVRKLTIASRTCHEIAYDISTKKTVGPVRYVYTRCRDTDGTWKFD